MSLAAEVVREFLESDDGRALVRAALTDRPLPPPQEEQPA